VTSSVKTKGLDDMFFWLVLIDYFAVTSTVKIKVVEVKFFFFFFFFFAVTSSVKIKVVDVKFLFYFFAVTSSVKIKVLDVPEMAQAGHNVHLTCDYDLERQSLYQVTFLLTFLGKISRNFYM
jgi:hypothetical protein